MVWARFKNRTLFLVAVALTGAIAGAFVWAFFLVMNVGLNFIWETVPKHFDFAFYPLVVCAIGGIFIGLTEKRFGPLPAELGEVMSEVKREGRYRYDNLGASSLAAILPLIFGGSVGPEAGLTGAIAGLCTWVGDRMKRFGSDFKELTEIGTSAALSAIFTAPLYGFAAPFVGNTENDDAITLPKKRKIICYLIAIAGALGAFFLLGSLFGRGGGLIHYSSLTLGTNELIWALPVALVGAVGGWLYHAFNALAKKIARLFGNKIVLRAVFAGVVLGAVGCVLPYTMFAGEAQMHVLSESWGSFGIAALFLTGIIKLFMGPLCVQCGWRGGNIFPVIFSGVALGYGMAALGGADPVFCIALCSAAVCGGVMRNPLMAALLLILCFPATAIVALFLAAALGSALPLPRAWKVPQPAKEEPATPTQ
ncbi:MAG: chloride channel protein [Raoultibacter sp.]